jgi:hypothetical protein
VACNTRPTNRQRSNLRTLKACGQFAFSIEQLDSAAARERRDRFVRDFSGVSADRSGRDLLGESSLEAELAFSKYADKPTAQPQPPLPPPGLRYPIIEQRQSLEGMRLASEKYNKARDHFVEMMDPVLSVH